MHYLIWILVILLPKVGHAIIDGEIISDESFRQSVALVFKKDNTQSSGQIYCSGTLIGPGLVITAAHCLTAGAKAFKTSLESFKEQTWIYVGESDNSPTLPMISPQYKAKKISIHPLNGSIYSDLALIELVEDLDLIQLKIMAYPLMTPTRDLLGNNLIHVGFGQILQDGVKGTKSLMQLPLRELNGYNGLGVGEMYKTGPGACHGDSGGSAYIIDEDKKIKFIGIEYGISNHPCGQSATYFIPLTQKIMDWIKKQNKEIFYE